MIKTIPFTHFNNGNKISKLLFTIQKEYTSFSVQLIDVEQILKILYQHCTPVSTDPVVKPENTGV